MMMRAAIVTAVCLGVAYTQTGTAQAPQTPASGQAAQPAAAANQQSVPASTCSEMSTALGRLLQQDARLRDWPQLARYRDDNANLKPPAAGENTRRLHGRFHHRPVAAAALRRFLSGQAVRRSRHQRADDAADAACASGPT